MLIRCCDDGRAEGERALEGGWGGAKKGRSFIRLGGGGRAAVEEKVEGRNEENGENDRKWCSDSFSICKNRC